MREARKANQAGRATHSDAYYSLNRYVIEGDRLSAVKLADLSEADLRAWQHRTARTKHSSIQRLVNDLKAALNAAFEAHRRVLPPDLPVTIKYGLKVAAPDTVIGSARDNQILSDDEVRRVVSAAIAIDDDLGHLVVLLAAIGALFSQLVWMTVSDVQPEQSRLMIPQSFKGRNRQPQHVRVGCDTLTALKPAVEGRGASAPLLERWRIGRFDR